MQNGAKQPCRSHCLCKLSCHDLIHRKIKQINNKTIGKQEKNDGKKSSDHTDIGRQAAAHNEKDDVAFAAIAVKKAGNLIKALPPGYQASKKEIADNIRHGRAREHHDR